MRALPVHRDTIDLLVTALLISSTNITPATARTPHITPNPTPSTVLDAADRIGQQLWDENFASVSHANNCHIPAPRYEWQPVAELLSAHIDTEQILQIERSRLYTEETSCHHTAWDNSAARTHLNRLSAAITARLHDHTLEPSPEHPGVIEYQGLSRATDEWTREIGFRTPLNASSARRITEGRAS